MLGKTANGLFWMYRLLERADCTARLVETGQRIALTRSGTRDDEWRSVLLSAGSFEGFRKYEEDLTKTAAVDWLMRSKDNPSSVLSCISNARQNARMVRTALTPEVWEATNYAYMRVRELLARKLSEREVPPVLDKVRDLASLVQGATHNTMLRNDIYDFTQLGTFLERADNTARILDVKYYVLLPSVAAVGSSLDNVQWDTILRSVSAHGGFRMQHSSAVGPREIARFVILDKQMPRSLAFCARRLRRNLERLRDQYGLVKPSLAMASDLDEFYNVNDIDTIFEFGLHEHTQQTLGEITALGFQIEQDYRFYE
ncbi:conserved hypothetical protein [Luminiphilus syltensis NOR5-1B]|uniref:DUF403 domain-containing protein n=1 Tax=Luminiphilus syltensis NOR5-1B TaxID=565045 RepID=B8KW76_9GAMM|nr:alpha-E domain-containing protein [Luminiphilus syltensis]EED36830.1 conserved hypothetical protein [Luminiphilus syltensis NOR5-1B]